MKSAIISPKGRRLFIYVTIMVALVLGVQNAATQKQSRYPEERLLRNEILHLDLPDEKQDQRPSRVLAPRLSWSKMVYQSVESNGWDIFIANDDGSGATRLTFRDWPDIHPDLRWGGDKIAFASNRDDDFEVFVMDIDGEGQVPLTNNEFDDVNPKWSPNGEKLLFESYRDGQPEIYTMNADGSSQTRVTYFGGYDGMPSWSPDGSKIAFVSQRNGGFDIFSMNADGSNVIQLSNQPFSFRPTWSPDGTRIAYDSDGEGWQELWIMNADGSDQEFVYSDWREDETDIWVRGWSPDGRYITFTQVYFVLYDENWYWYRAEMKAKNPDLGHDLIRFTNTETAWAPHWQSLDVVAPTGQLDSLPSPSPGPIALHWEGSDVGGSGVASYDIQVKVGSQGVWSDWQTGTSPHLLYPGIGGSLYQFRMRARDAAFNVQPWTNTGIVATTVENQPPSSRVMQLPPYIKVGQKFLVSWSGHDTGGSGIAGYNIERRGHGGDWSIQENDTLETSLIEHTSGHPVSVFLEYRSQAIDNAANIEPWPENGNDASTTIYLWGIMGRAYDNAHTPVSGTAVETTAGDVGILPSNADGEYATYTDRAGTYEAAVSWHNDNYAELDNAVYKYNGGSPLDWQIDAIMPPTDNIVQDWGFENGILEPAWVASGSNPPNLTSDFSHTGASSLLFGSEGAFGERHQTGQGVRDYRIGLDSLGNAHAIYYTGQLSGINYRKLMYTVRVGESDWSEPIELSNSQWGISSIQLEIDSEDNVHIMWRAESDDSSSYYAKRSLDGAWSTPELITGTTYSSPVHMSLGLNGVIHFVWECDWQICYAQRGSAGGYLYETFEGEDVSRTIRVASDLEGNAHIIWESDNELYYTKRSSNEGWSSPIAIVRDDTTKSVFLISPLGRLQLVWLEAHRSNDQWLYYAYADENGWSEPILVSQNLRIPDVDSFEVNDFDMVLDNQGGVHIAWTEQVRHLSQDKASVNYVHFDQYVHGLLGHRIEYADKWQRIETIDLATDQDNQVHLLWQKDDPRRPPLPRGSSFFYRKMVGEHDWSPVYPLFFELPNITNDLEDPHMFVGHDSAVYIVGRSDSSDNEFIQDRKMILSESDVDSTISQVVTIPGTMETPVLSFLYQYWGVSDDPGNRFMVEVDDGSGKTAVYSTENANGEWTHGWVDLSPWQGQTVTVEFSVLQKAGEPRSWVYLDEVSLGSSYPDVWVSQSRVTGLPGELVSFEVEYGNRGGALAKDAQITLTLPPELTFVEAFPAPTAVSPNPIWDIGNITAKSDSFKIRITGRIAADSTLFDTVSTTASIDLSNSELEKLNNLAEGDIFIGRSVYMPVIRSQN